jgi:hypothetical protein
MLPRMLAIASFLQTSWLRRHTAIQRSEIPERATAPRVS